MWSLKVVVIAIVVAVSLGQRDRRLRVQSSAPVSRRPTPLSGASSVAVNPTPRRGVAIRRPSRPVRINPGGIRRNNLNTPLQNRRNQLVNIPQRTPTIVPKPVQEASVTNPSISSSSIFHDEDFDYFADYGLNDADLVFPNEIIDQAPPKPVTEAPIRQLHRQNTQAPSAAHEVQSIARSHAQTVVRKTIPRRGLNNNFQQTFNFNAQQPQQVQQTRQPVVQQQSQQKENLPRGRKEPEIQIIKSWSNRNSDGTFSYGYINTDGSFKNETKGTDCVVRGVYGYIDQDTGKTMTFPYETGNPCDPNSQDYFYDYESGTLNIQGHPIPRKNQASNKAVASSSNRNTRRNLFT